MNVALFDVRSGERRNAIGAFLTLFGMLAGHSILETARDTLFLMDISASRLPFVYLGIAAVAVLLTQFQVRVQATDARRRVSILSLGVAAFTCVFWLLLDHSGPWLLYALYVWSGLAATVLVVRFWTVAGDLFTVTQAKRLFPLIGSGSILGAIAGSAAAQSLVSNYPPSFLILSAAVTFALTSLAPMILSAPERAERPSMLATEDAAAPTDAMNTVKGIAHHPYLGRVAALLIISTMTVTLADFLFKSELAARVPMAQLGWVLATTSLVINVLSLVAQLVLVGWITRRLQVDRVLSVLPAMLLLGAGWLLLGGGLLAVFALRAIDGTFRHSLQRTANEVLYVPLSSEWRSKAKGIIDVAGQRGGQALASIGLLLAGWLGASTPVLGGVLFALCVVWIALAHNLKRPYFDVFRRTLDEGSRLRRNLDFPDLDLSSLESLIQALGSPDENEVVAALELLEEKDKAHLISALILWHPSAKVIVRALELFRTRGRTDHLRLAERLLEHSDATVREAALLAFPSNEEHGERFQRALRDESPVVRATALVGLMTGEETPHPRTQSILDTLVFAGSADAKVGLARAIAARPHHRFDGVLKSLAAAPEPEVGREVAVAMRSEPKMSYVETLFDLLQVRATREEARLTLVAMGEEALAACAEALADEQRPDALRSHLPRTICRFEPQPAADALIRQLPNEHDGTVRYKILRGLGRCRSRDADVKIDPQRLDRAIERTIGSSFEGLDWLRLLDEHERRNPDWNTPVRQLIKSYLEDKQGLARERLFRLLSLRYPREDFMRIYRGMESGDRTSIASGRELIEGSLPSGCREAVLALLDDEISAARRLAEGGRYYQRRNLAPAELTKVFLQDDDFELRTLVAHHVGEIGIAESRPDIQELVTRASDKLAEALRHAVARLETPHAERAFVVPIR